jgi:2-alkenal reductase
VLPSVVRIKVEKSLVPRALRGSRQAPEGFNVPGEGSGFVWSDRGHVVTNHHVVADADRITVIFADGSELDAELLGSDPGSDLAVLKVEPPSGGLREVVLGDSGSLKVGQLAVAIGSPYGQDFTMTRGIVSALGRAIPSVEGGFSNPQVIQTDAPINPGNSGGPLLDRRGKVIGINSQIISSSGANAGVGFAVPINTAKRIVPELIADGTYEYAYLGINGASLTPRLAEANDLPGDTRGTLVVGLVNGGPAEEAGLHAADATSRLEGSDYPIGGDVITGIDGETIVEMNDLIAYLAENNRPGDEVTLEVLRDGGTKSRVDVKLGSRPGPATG